MKRLHNERIAWFREKADESFWDDHWRGMLTRESYAAYAGGHLGPFEGAFTQHLAREGRVVEAGCGIGQYVMALRARGWNAEGVEFASATMGKVRELWPDLPVRCGDVRRFDVPDGHYSGYISLGVMEHAEEGPQVFLRKANRVLATGGAAFISVPFVNRLRQAKRAVGCYRAGGCAREEFYQYAFDRQEFPAILRRHGFQPVEMIAYGGIDGIRDEVPALRRFMDRTAIGRRFTSRLGASALCDCFCGHMMMFVCRKRNGLKDGSVT